MFTHLIAIGLVIWAAGTAAIRLAGQYVLRPGHPVDTLILYGASVIVMAVVVRWLSVRLTAAPSQRARAVLALMLPTLVLDPLSCVFFATVFPNVDPAAAGLFGGWMLACCAGAAASVGIGR
jgi:hypothetical protein